MAGIDSWPVKNFASVDWGASPIHAFTITPADSDFVNYARMIECSDDCTLKVTLMDDTTITKTFYRGENWIPVKRVWSTGSTLGAATLIGWY